MSGLLAWDGNLLLWIQNAVRNPVMTPFMKTVTHLGDKGIFWIILTLALLAFPRTRRVGFYSFCALVCSYLVNNVCLKHLVARTRPYEVVQGLELIVARATDFSFPSGHSAASFASATAIFSSIRRKKWGILLLALALIIALSRLYVGIHYPTDVICGTISGILCGLAGVWIGKRLAELPFMKRLLNG